jgi:hypothetical protein
MNNDVETIVAKQPRDTLIKLVLSSLRTAMKIVNVYNFSMEIMQWTNLDKELSTVWVLHVPTIDNKSYSYPSTNIYINIKFKSVTRKLKN